MDHERAVTIIDAAFTQEFISQSQADLLREELSMFPGGNVLSLMTRRGMISLEQAQELENPPETPVDVDTEFNASFNEDKAKTDTPPPVSQSPTPRGFQSGADSRSSTTDRHLNAGQTPPVPQFQTPPRPTPTQAPRENPTSPAPAPRRSMADALGEARNALHRPAVTVSEPSGKTDAKLINLLKTARERNCSDVHITVDKPPYMRQEGRIFFLGESPLTPDEAKKLNFSVLTKDQLDEFDRNLQVDFSFELPGAGRFRANVYKQRRGVEGAFRIIPQEVPTLSSLNLSKTLNKLTTYPQGLNLVTGPGGCGKTTTVAAMLEHINCNRHDHIITVEDPVEYVFQPKECQITQREVGTHTDSFATALRTALRQDPDVIMIGELRDLETTSIAITAAETGHLVFGTLHTGSAVRTVARVLDVFPPGQRSQICMMVAESLRGIISQQLIPKRNGEGRVCAMEILVVTIGVSQVIKEGKTHQLVSHMQSGRKQGMISMDDALMDLYKAGHIAGREAWSRADNKSTFEMMRTQS